MMTARSDIEHWQINATVYKDRVEEIHYITDPASNIRRRPQTKVWKVERFLGCGGFGEVRLEKSTEDGKERAVKRIPTASANLNLEECERELKALLEFSKPKSKEAAVFVDFFGWFKDGSDVFLAMEYVPLGDLETNVAAHSGKVPEAEARDITQQILLGLEIMHAESFAHRDLKPQNVLVVHGPPQWWVKLADFGLSKRLTETTAYYTKSGTQSYMAPEILDYLDTDTLSTEYTNAVDLWAIGCITYRLVTSFVPFPLGRSLGKYCEDKSLFPVGPLFNCGMKSSCIEFIRDLLEPHPEVRPSASQALAHTWVTLGSNTGKRSGDLSQSNQGTSGCSEFTASDIGYNTVSHDGLKSYRLPSPSHTGSSYTQYSSQTRSALDTNSSTASNHLAVTFKSHTSSDSESLVRQLSTEEEATPPTPKFDILANPSSTKVSSATLQVVPRSLRSSLDGKPVALSLGRKLIASASQDNTAQTILKKIIPIFKSQKTSKVRAVQKLKEAASPADRPKSSHNGSERSMEVRRERTPEEQEAHDKRKAERRAKRKAERKAAEAEEQVQKEAEETALKEAEELARVEKEKRDADRRERRRMREEKRRAVEDRLRAEEEKRKADDETARLSHRERRRQGNVATT